MWDYQDFTLFDLWAEIRKLPPIPKAAQVPQELRATGNDGAVICADNVALPVALRSDRKGVKRSTTDRNPNGGDVACHLDNSLESKGTTAFPASQSHYRRLDSNQRHPAPQAGALAN